MRELQRCRVAELQAGALLVALVLAIAAPLRAQSTETDPRWQAWLGCWEPMSGPARAPGDSAAVPLVCVVPAAGSVGVDVVTVAAGQVVSRELVEATGEHRSVTRDGCAGWENAEFSARGDRVFLTAEYTCPGDLKRATSELMAITPQGEWLDVRGASVRGLPSGVRVLRYNPAPQTAAVPSDLEWATTGGGMAVSTAREAAGQPIAASDVVEATRHVDPSVVEAWLAEEAQPFDLTGAQLLALKREGVPPRVLDVMVAVSYPDVFAMNVSNRQVERRAAPASPSNGYYGAAGPAFGWGYASPYGCYSPFAWNCYSPYGWGYYSPYINSPYGYYSPYGYWGGYGYYPPGGVVVISGGGGQTARHGRMVIGRGYTQGAGAAQPPALAPRRGARARASSPPPSSGERSRASSPPPSSSGERAPSAPSGGSGRRAVPKPGR
jgi:hypothetical protein